MLIIKDLSSSVDAKNGITKTARPLTKFVNGREPTTKTGATRSSTRPLN
jgi:hypothetical protein